jgi:hypothetical protein
MRRKENISLRIKAVEETRLKVLAAISKVSGVEQSELNLNKITELASAPFKDKLNEIKDGLRGVIDKTDDLNRINRGLIEKLLRLNYESATHLQGLLEPSQTYVRRGAQSPRLRSGQVVRETL